MDVSSIPKKYGGDLDFECGMLPSIDPEIRKCLDLPNPKLEDLFLTGPTRWVDGSEGDMIGLSVGSIDGKPHKEAVATMHSWAVRTATGSSNFQRMHADYFQRMDSNYSAQQPVSRPASTIQSRPQSKADNKLPVQMQPPPSADMPPATASIQQPAQQPQIQSAQLMPPPPVPSNPAQPQPQIQPQPPIVPESQSTLSNGSVLKSAPAGLDGATEMQNGGAAGPKSIVMPPTQLQRMETQYMTPATEPSELKNFSER